MTDFLNAMNIISDTVTGANSSSSEECKSAVDHYMFYQFSLIPAVLITLSFCATKRRRQLLLQLLHGRPGLIFPMDTLTRTSRISYACCYGATAMLVYKIVLDKQYAIQFSGDRAVKSFVVMASMFIYGMVFFPLFASLAIGSVFGYSLGALYVWMLTAVEIFRLTDCETTVRNRILLVLRGLPIVLCLLYLSVSIPVRMVMAWKKGRYFKWQDHFQETNTLEDIRASYNGDHVTKLFRKPKIKFRPGNKKRRAKSLAVTLFHRFIYQRKRGFRYSSRMLSVLFVAVLVIYMLTFEELILFLRLFNSVEEQVLHLRDVSIGSEAVENEPPNITQQRRVYFTIWWFLNTLKICFVVANIMASLLSLANILHTLSSYRANLFALYRGDHSHIPPASTSSNTSHCVSSIKYAGFQVGYIIWAFVLQNVVLMILIIALATFIILIISDATGWILWIIELLWPIVVTMVLLMVVQTLMAKFVFLQEKGRFLALDNRSVFFNFTYFMFFYNIFMGLASCLMRILKSIVLGLMLMGRLDNSILPQRFQFFDPGFKAYVGYMHMEAAHTHPVLIVFARLMLLGLSEKKERNNADDTLEPPSSSHSDHLELVMKDNRVHADDSPKEEPTETLPDPYEEKRRRGVAARFNWHVTYTLLHNPDIRVMRKGYLNMLRQARLLGIHIAASDTQADVNFETLQKQIAEAKEKLEPPKKKKKGQDNKNVEGDLEEVVTAVEEDDVKNAKSVNPAGVGPAQEMKLQPEPPAKKGPSKVPEETGKVQEVQGGKRNVPAPAGDVSSEDFPFEVFVADPSHWPTPQDEGNASRGATPKLPSSYVNSVDL